MIVFALAALAAAGAASAQVVRPPGAVVALPAVRAPLLSAAAVSDAPLAPSLFSVRVLGIPGPGVTPAQLEAVKALAARTGEAIVVHGGRQSGPFTANSGLDLGVVGPAEKLLAFKADMWDGRSPTLAVATIEDAVGRGHLVVAPVPARLIGQPGALQREARPWRTDEQLTKLAAAPRAAGDSFTFAVIGDAEPGRFWFSRTLFNKPGVFWKLLKRADRSGSDFILQLGDMVSRGTVGNFKAFIRRLFLNGTSTPYLTALGNHDRRKPHGVTDDIMYRTAFGSPDYSFTRGGWRFVVVDSSAGRVTAAQLQWLAGELDPAVPTVVFTHIPPAPLSEWTDWGAFKGAGGFKDGSAAFMRLMSENKVARVYTGHIHALGVLERGGVKYVLTGGGGSPLFPGPVKRRLHHWLSVEAGPNGLVETVHTADGASFPLR